MTSDVVNQRKLLYWIILMTTYCFIILNFDKNIYLIHLKHIWGQVVLWRDCVYCVFLCSYVRQRYFSFCQLPGRLEQGFIYIDLVGILAPICENLWKALTTRCVLFIEPFAEGISSNTKWINDILPSNRWGKYLKKALYLRNRKQ